MTDAQIIEAALTILPLLHDLLGSRAPEAIRQLTSWLDGERAGSKEAADEILAILSAHPETRQWLREYLPDTIDTRKSFRGPAAAVGAPAPVTPAVPKPSSYTAVKIFFATDREATSATEPRRVFSGERAPDGALRFGTCNVSIPAKHAKGKLEAPWFLRSYWEDPGRHVVLLRVDPMAGQDFFAAVRRDGKQALLFIHGYNVTFEDAARRTAQIAWDLNYAGTPILYSWPSRGSPALYSADEASVEWSAAHLKTFLCDLAERGGLTDLHVIAHSMGNRALTTALRLLGLESAPVHHVREVILTAPDVDSGLFRQMGADIVKTPRRITLYASQDDLALQASKKFHKYARAGDSGDGIVILPGIDSVDATGADTSFLGHSYFGSVRSIISDVYYALGGLPAAQRSDLREVAAPAGTYFRYAV